MTRKKILLIVLLCIASIALYTAWRLWGHRNTHRITEAIPTTGPASHWAEKMECSGVGNFHRVSDILYRGEQPTEEGFANLSKMGIKMVISLRQIHGDSKKIGDLPLKYKRIRFNTWSPKDEHVVEFLKLVADPENHPIFLHCKHGSDRTGMMCAVYRVVHEGWTREQAIAEWTKGGFGFHAMFQNLLKYFRSTDLKSLAPSSAASKPALQTSLSSSRYRPAA
ncbi:MAG: hypothetical protein HN350_21120 [Phycisphaerales bacterium]|jgi:tyrosine-protein phosphatase SIW14|nr:hypothetical protein [Phycisphaerales bacterium]